MFRNRKPDQMAINKIAARIRLALALARAAAIQGRRFSLAALTGQVPKLFLDDPFMGLFFKLKTIALPGSYEFLFAGEAGAAYPALSFGH